MKNILGMIAGLFLGVVIAWGSSHTTTSRFDWVGSEIELVPSDKIQFRVVHGTYNYTTVLLDWTVPTGFTDFEGHATVHGTLNP